MMNASTGAWVAFGTTVFGKLYMSFAHRIKNAVFKGPKAQEVHMNEKRTKEDHATQLNEAEYAPLICGALMYLSSKGIDAPIATTLAVVGNSGYLFARYAFGVHVLTTSPFATMRYTGMLLLTKALYDAA